MNVFAFALYAPTRSTAPLPRCTAQAGQSASQVFQVSGLAAVMPGWLPASRLSSSSTEPNVTCGANPPIRFSAASCASGVIPAQASAMTRTCAPPSTASSTVAITQQSVLTPQTVSSRLGPSMDSSSGPHLENVVLSRVPRPWLAHGWARSARWAASGASTCGQAR